MKTKATNIDNRLLIVLCTRPLQLVQLITEILCWTKVPSKSINSSYMIHICGTLVINKITFSCYNSCTASRHTFTQLRQENNTCIIPLILNDFFQLIYIACMSTCYTTFEIVPYILNR